MAVYTQHIYINGSRFNMDIERDYIEANVAMETNPPDISE